MAAITIFRARTIVTMNPSNPEATHVAVREGKILGAGSLDELAGWGPYELDETFGDLVLVPGFVEGHSHSNEGLTVAIPMVGYFDRRLPDGRMSRGVTSYAELIERLRAEADMLADPDAPLIVRGFDPIYFAGEERLSVRHLDQVSATRPVFVWHASGHLATVNSAMLRRHSITRDHKGAGVGRFPDGEPNGELQELPGISLAESAVRTVMALTGSEGTLRGFGAAALTAGITTVSELGGMMLAQPHLVELWQRVVNDPAFPARVAVYNAAAGMPGLGSDYAAMAAEVRRLRAEAASEKLRFPGVKLILDGSIQGWTAMLAWPGYYTGEDHGQLLTVPEQLADWMRPFHQAGISVHAHCNGDLTTDIFLDAVEQLLREHAWLDHRHTCQHAQLTSAAQLRRMRKLGVCANFFANHLWYWGDQHYEQTVGPERANRLEPCASALREGVPFSFHTDASVTPLGHLHTMWCAVNRLTPKGRVLGEHEKISAYEALRAATLGAAYQMHLDGEIGSIECGKWADFTVLEASPLEVDPPAIREIGIWGTVVGGVKYEAPQG